MILIGADLVPTKSNEELFNKGNAEELIGTELCKMLESADYKIFNLEVPLAYKKTPIPKYGPNLIAAPSTIVGYTAIGVSLLTIANNHIMDQGEEGFLSTLSILSKNRIPYVGGGINAAEASRPYIIQNDGKKIGIYACCEHEFSSAGKRNPGANTFNTLESYDHVVELQKQCDYVIVLYHGGKEHYRYPSPDLQRYCRKFVDKGANLVICQHSHCVGCKEEYKNGTIVYGQGNFLFDHSNSEYWKTSLLIQIKKDFQISYIPLVKQNEVVRMAKEKVAEDILSEFEYRSQEIKKEGFIESRYSQFTKGMLEGYLWTMSGGSKSTILRLINKLTGYRFYKIYLMKKYDTNTFLGMINFFECEAHRELILNALKNKI